MTRPSFAFAWFMSVSLALASMSAAAADAPPGGSTNRLIWEKPFQAQIKRYFGKAHGSFFWKNGLLSEQVSAGLGGPPDDIQALEGGLYLASACRAHSCPEKGAAVIDAGKRPLAFALVHYQCFKSAKANCDEQPSMVIFFKGKVLDARLRQVFVDWAEGEVGDRVAVDVRPVP